MKLSELKVGQDYAVVPSWTYSNRNARDVDTCRENDVVKATLISTDKYIYEPSMRKEDKTAFTKAEAGNRSVGVLVSAKDSSGKDYFWTSRLADIVAPYSVLEPKWAEKKKEYAKQEEAEREKRRLISEAQENARNLVNTSRESITITTKELLGNDSKVNVTTEGYGLDTHAVVSISLREFEQLLELAYEGKELSV